MPGPKSCKRVSMIVLTDSDDYIKENRIRLYEGGVKEALYYLR
jgi:hypothetical protein